MVSKVCMVNNVVGVVVMDQIKRVLGYLKGIWVFVIDFCSGSSVVFHLLPLIE